MKKQWINVLNVDIYCEHILNGKPPILLIHGFLSSTYTYNRLIPLLEKSFSIVAIDLPGFGRSEKSTSFIYSYEKYGELVSACMDYFHFDQVTIVGHSMGGQIALNVSKLVPERVNKLILLCSSGYLKKANKLLIYSSYLPFFHHLVALHVKKKGVKASLQNVLYNHELITEEMMTEYKRPFLEKAFYKSLVRLLRYREGDLTTEQLKAIQIQTLLLWGEEDKVVPLEIGKRLVQDLPNAQLIKFKNAGHLLTDDIPERVYENIMHFIFGGTNKNEDLYVEAQTNG
ncbi:alpha/beta fold hydrolase [Evansella halocellulosilytica]|uniref:alpha/beta fold hydrolase n=1 Tax=Evansella halocellulosilytica TaxID=2011013 RepID=UPI00211B759D|nr:alpha/beta hydrolase [Evansella halocellulosilytica]